MINALLTIALVQSLGFAADLRLALRGDGFDDGYDLNAKYRFDRLFLSGLPLLRLRLAHLIFGFKAASPGQPERRLLKHSGREIWQFSAGTPC